MGLDNYLIILKDSAFHDALLHNGFIVVMSLIIQGPVAVVLALLLNQKMRGARSSGCSSSSRTWCLR